MSLFRKSETIYKGLHAGGAPGAHEALISLILKSIGPQSGVLDLGASAGSLLQRMLDNGFSDMHAADLDKKSLSVSGLTHTKVDLNSDFSAHFDRTFSLITATEVIEHIDNPRRFLKNIHTLLSDKAYIGLTFPNIGFWKGRIKFMLKGEIWGFGGRHVRSLRHVSPITLEMIKMMLQETGFALTALTTAGSFSTPVSWVLTFPLWMPIYLIGGKRTLGECVVLIARKTKPQQDLRIPDAYREVWDKRDIDSK